MGMTDVMASGRVRAHQRLMTLLRDADEAVADPRAKPPSGQRDEQVAGWDGEELAGLTALIRRSHHAYTREALDRLGPLCRKVASEEGGSYPSLVALRRLVEELDQDLRPHLEKEERMLFPYIEELEAAVSAGHEPGASPFGTVRNPVRMMMLEHDRCFELLREIRETASDYHVPQGADASVADLYSLLQELERDLRQHIHLEADLLFPRAVALEDGP
jgi:regulator of cell morphogenesis and NO signaling